MDSNTLRAIALCVSELFTLLLIDYISNLDSANVAAVRVLMRPEQSAKAGEDEIYTFSVTTKY
jgi:hypothetical protein